MRRSTLFPFAGRGAGLAVQQPLEPVATQVDAEPPQAEAEPPNRSEVAATRQGLNKAKSESKGEGARKQIGRYLLFEPLGSGGMGTVYRGTAEFSSWFRKEVAVKVLHGYLDESSQDSGKEDYRGMFEDEARLAARLTHPNVCQVFDFGVDQEQAFIAMELLEGESVSRIGGRAGAHLSIRNEGRYPSHIARIIADAAEGLHAAHELRNQNGELINVVHRDISPTNIMVTYDGVVKLMDFGLAKTSDQRHKTRSHVVKGKLRYMSPEQLQGHALDRRSDVWSLGVVFWEALVGGPLFPRSATPSDVANAVVYNPIPRPSEVNPNIDAKLDSIVMRAIERDPEKRMPSGMALADAIHDWMGSDGRHVDRRSLSAWMRLHFGPRPSSPPARERSGVQTSSS